MFGRKKAQIIIECMQSHHTQRPLQGLSDNTKAFIRQRRRMRKGANTYETHTHLHSSWTIACTLLRFTLAFQSPVALSVCLTAETHGFHTQTRRAVINSITHTSVNTNEAKTNPFLFMFCLHFTKKALFLFLIIQSMNRQYFTAPEQPQLSKFTDGFSPISVSCFLSIVFFFLSLLPRCLSVVYLNCFLRETRGERSIFLRLFTQQFYHFAVCNEVIQGEEKDAKHSVKDKQWRLRYGARKLWLNLLTQLR